MPTLPIVGPFGLPTDTDPPDFYQGAWRSLFQAALAMGRLSVGWAMTATGSSTSFTVGPGAALVAGFLAQSDSTITLDVATAPGATTPSSGQTRIDLVVLTCDPSAQTVTLEVKPGTPASSGAIPPTLTRTPTGVWQEPLAQITRTGNTAVTTAAITAVRNYVAPTVLLDPARPLPTDLPVATIAVRGTDLHAHQLDAGGSPVWQPLTNPEFTAAPWTFATGMRGQEPMPKFRVVGGRLEGSGEVIRSSGAAFPTDGTLLLGTLPTSFASGLTASRYAQASTNRSSGCRVHAEPAPGGSLVNVFATTPVNTTAVVLDGWSVPLI